jgi:hypothetical protein
MEFLDVNLSKDSSLLLQLFTVPSTGGFYRKSHSNLVLEIHTKKFRKTRKLESIHE